MLALAGYQNRDKLIEMFNGAAGTASSSDGGGQPRAQGNAPGGLGSILGGAGIGGLLAWRGSQRTARTIHEKRSGRDGRIVDRTWPEQGGFASSAQAGYQDVLIALVQQTGLSQEELLAPLSQELPTAVDKYTPEGRLPARAT
jgi:uncharacterized protein YidB (DUF937 family)